MKRTKSIIACIFVVLMVASLFPTAAFASSVENDNVFLTQETVEFNARVDEFIQKYGSIGAIEALPEDEKAAARAEFELAFPELAQAGRVSTLPARTARASYYIELVNLPTVKPDYALYMDEAGWEVIETTIDGLVGASAVGMAIAALCGHPVPAAVAALIGGVVVVSKSAVKLQFALGAPIAVITF